MSELVRCDFAVVVVAQGAAIGVVVRPAECKRFDVVDHVSKADDTSFPTHAAQGLGTDTAETLLDGGATPEPLDHASLQTCKRPERLPEPCWSHVSDVH